MKTEKLYVITPISNAVRFRSRYSLFGDYRARMQAAGVNLFVVETAFGDRPFQVSTSADIQLRTWDEMWHKENMINVAISRLPSDWEYVAWVDGDITFMRPDWAIETVHQLQHHMVVQMFQTAIDMGPSGQALNQFSSFAWCHSQGLRYGSKGSTYGYGANGIYWHPGFCWAARREAIDATGGLIDRSILGAGDHHMALSLIGGAVHSLPKGIGQSYVDYVMDWQSHAERFVRRDIGFVPGSIAHHWHGKKIDRRYSDRWKILIDNKYDPAKDIKRDWQGMYQLVDDGTLRFIALRDGIRKYFRSRSEDSIDLE
jgi:hypothetical protein